MFLAEKNVAKIVVDSLFRGTKLGHYQLGPFVIMPNHLHALFLPLIPQARFLKSIKRSIARDANTRLDRARQPFWQSESFEHWVRNEMEWKRIAHDIEQNPMRGGLAETIEEYPWSSAHVNAARTSARATAQARIPA